MNQVRRQRMKLIAICILVYLCFSLVIWFGLGSINMSKFSKLIDDGEPTEATVVLPDCKNHMVVSYNFEVNGKMISGIGSRSDCNQLRPGDRIQIWYLRSQPTINMPKDPTKAALNERITMGMAAVGMPAMLIGIILFRRRKLIALKDVK